MMVVGSANVAEVKWMDICGGEMSWTAVVEGGKLYAYGFGGCGEEMRP